MQSLSKTMQTKANFGHSLIILCSNIKCSKNRGKKGKKILQKYKKEKKMRKNQMVYTITQVQTYELDNISEIMTRI